MLLTNKRKFEPNIEEERKQYNEQAFFIVLENKDLLNLITSFQKGKKYKDWKKADDIARSGHLKLIVLKLKWNEKLEFHTEGITGAVVNGHLEILQWMYKNDCMNFMEQIDLDHAFYETSKSGYLHILQFLYSIKSHVQAIYPKYIRDMNGDRCMNYGHLEMVKWLFNNKKATFSDYGIEQACFYGHLKVIEFIYPRIPIQHYPNAINRAAEGGFLDIVKYFHKENHSCTTHAMNCAARNGHLKVVKFLHEIGKDCTTDAMNGAAEFGHLEIVKFLHENRTEGCTTEAMNFAAKNGHFETIIWLHVNRKEGCSPLAFDYACSNGHLEIAKWLFINKPCGPYQYALAHAIINGHLYTAQWLYELGLKDYNIYALCTAVGRGYLELVKWLCQTQKTSVEIVQLICFAVYYGQLEITEWLYEKWQNFFPKNIIDLSIIANRENVAMFLQQKQVEDISLYDIERYFGLLETRWDVKVIVQEALLLCFKMKRFTLLKIILNEKFEYHSETLKLLKDYAKDSDQQNFIETFYSQ